MHIETPFIDGLAVITPRRFGDDRGWFSESWNAGAFRDAGLAIEWVQDNHSYSAEKGTLRGLHYQTPPHAQDKLVRCTRGAIWDVAVDFRKDSPTYLRHFGVELTAANGTQLLVPAGFLHGFVTLEDQCEVQYKCSAPYAPDCDAAIRWDDPALGIDWPLHGAPVMSDKDAAAPLVADTTSPF
jgi:dTDP-4-dehydrorhamnose 3,5-epimerase